MTDGSGVNHREYNRYEADRLGRDVAQTFFIYIDLLELRQSSILLVITPGNNKEEEDGKCS